MGSVAILATASLPNPVPVRSNAPPEARYDILINAVRPAEAQVRLTLSVAPARLVPARDGNGAGITQVRCSDGRPLTREGNAWIVPVPQCTRISWRLAMPDVDPNGLDASLPNAAHSPRHGYWLLPERDGLLRAANDGGRVAITLRLEDGRTVRRVYAFPSNDQPPFYAVIGRRPTLEYRHAGMTLRVFGAPPDYPWMAAVHHDVLATWSAWRRDLVSGTAPATIDWVWVRPPDDLPPGYNASAGAEAIVSQLRVRDGDPDAEAKARVIIATSAAHEGFHTITGAAGQAWPAWANESLANHFAIAAARRFLAPEDHRWLEAFYIAPEVRAPLLEAQARYSAGDGEQAQIFYTYGARFWGEIETVLVNPPNGSGRLAALIRASGNFAGTDLMDAEGLADLLDRHSDGRAGPIVRCYLRGIGCPRDHRSAGRVASRAF